MRIFMSIVLACLLLAAAVGRLVFEILEAWLARSPLVLLAQLIWIVGAVWPLLAWAGIRPA